MCFFGSATFTERQPGRSLGLEPKNRMTCHLAKTSLVQYLGIIMQIYSSPTKDSIAEMPIAMTFHFLQSKFNANRVIDLAISVNRRCYPIIVTLATSHVKRHRKKSPSDRPGPKNNSKAHEKAVKRRNSSLRLAGDNFAVTHEFVYSISSSSTMPASSPRLRPSIKLCNAV